jgi:hypothetical protein
MLLYCTVLFNMRFVIVFFMLVNIRGLFIGNKGKENKEKNVKQKGKNVKQKGNTVFMKNEAKRV